MYNSMKIVISLRYLRSVHVSNFVLLKLIISGKPKIYHNQNYIPNFLEFKKDNKQISKSNKKKFNDPPIFSLISLRIC